MVAAVGDGSGLDVVEGGNALWVGDGATAIGDAELAGVPRSPGVEHPTAMTTAIARPLIRRIAGPHLQAVETFIEG